MQTAEGLKCARKKSFESVQTFQSGICQLKNYSGGGGGGGNAAPNSYTHDGNLQSCSVLHTEPKTSLDPFKMSQE
jgi:hypothetical protein